MNKAMGMLAGAALLAMGAGTANAATITGTGTLTSDHCTHSLSCGARGQHRRLRHYHRGQR